MAIGMFLHGQLLRSADHLFLCLRRFLCGGLHFGLTDSSSLGSVEASLVLSRLLLLRGHCKSLLRSYIRATNLALHGPGYSTRSALLLVLHPSHIRLLLWSGLSVLTLSLIHTHTACRSIGLGTNPSLRARLLLCRLAILRRIRIDLRLLRLLAYTTATVHRVAASVRGSVLWLLLHRYCATRKDWLTRHLLSKKLLLHRLLLLLWLHRDSTRRLAVFFHYTVICVLILRLLIRKGLRHSLEMLLSHRFLLPSLLLLLLLVS